MRKMLFLLLAAALATSMVALGAADTALAGKPHIKKGCTNCHEAQPKVLRGDMVSHSPKFKTVQLSVGPLVWIVKYTDETILMGAEDLKEVTKGKPIAITYTGTEDSPVAARISVKPPFTVPDEKQVSVEEMKKLTAEGPEKGGYMLVDSRPPGAYIAGHIPGAVNLPFPALKKKGEAALGPDKDKRIIFYCGGFV
jgi:hypothetical protein